MTIRRGIGWFALLWMACLPCIAQRPGSGQTGGRGGQAGGSSAASSDIPRLIFLSGKVLLPDGSAPPKAVEVQRDCNGKAVTEGLTDLSGYFSVNLNQTNRANQGPDAMARELSNCELRFTLAGYYADTIPLGAGRIYDNPYLGTITLQPFAVPVGFTVSATTLLAPQEARKHFQKGLAFMGKLKLAVAQREFEKAVAVYPRFATAWCALGVVRRAQGNVGGALEALRRSSEADDRYVRPHLELMQYFRVRGEWTELARESGRVIQLNATRFPQAFYLNAVAHFNLEHFSEAERSANDALQLDTDHRYPGAELILGMAQAKRGNSVAALVSLRAYSKRVKGPELEAVNREIAEIERRAEN